jgi:hypothetical protein
LSTVKDVRGYIRDIVSMNQINYKKIDEIMEQESSSDTDEVEIRKEIKIVFRNIENKNLDSNKKENQNLVLTNNLKKQNSNEESQGIKKSNTKNSLNSSYHTSFRTEKNEKNTKGYNTNNIKTVKPQERTSSVIAKNKVEGGKINDKNNVTAVTNLKIVKTEIRSSNFITNNEKIKPKTESAIKKSSSTVTTKPRTTSNIQPLNKTSIRRSSQIKMDTNIGYSTNFKTVNNQTTKNKRPASPHKSSIIGI